MATKTFGLLGVATALLIGCGGGAESPIIDSTTASGESGAKLPPSSPSGPSAPKKSEPAGGTAGGQTEKKDPQGQAPGNDPGGQNGQPGQNGQSVCCHNNMAYDCPDTKSCLGGYDLEGCQDACAIDDLDCQLACVDKLSTISPPTAACKPKGKCF